MATISNELNNLLENLIGKDKEKFISQIGKGFGNVIRFNSLRGNIENQKTLLEEQGFEISPLKLRDYIFRVEKAPYPIGKTISHFLGHIYVQDLSSMLPPIVLNPEPGDYVLDVSAAPGSKTTQLAALMENEGVLVGNDADPKRTQALSHNLERMGAINAHALSTAGERLGKLYPETFDKVLLDPPCSGIGTLQKNPEILGWWDESYSKKLSDIQYRLFFSALKALKPGGIIVYSTCTITPKENEMVVQKVIDKFPLKILPIPELPGINHHPGLTTYKEESFSEDMHKTIRVYPHENNSEGFFVALLQKTESMDLPPNPSTPHRFNWTPSKQSPVKKYVDMATGTFGIDRKYLHKFKYSQTKIINFVNKETADFPLYFKPHRFGLSFCKILKDGFKLTTEATLFFGDHLKKNILELEKDDLIKFLNRENFVIKLGPEPMQKVIKYKGNYFGYGFYNGKKLRSQMPKAGWGFRW